MSLISRFVMTDGVSPGIGKSALTAGLAGRAAAAGLDLELFGEDLIFTCPAFAEIGRAFRDRTYPTAEMMLQGYARPAGVPALERPEQPALEETDHQMGARQQLVGLLAAPGDVADPVVVAGGGEAQVATPAIGVETGRIRPGGGAPPGREAPR